MNRRKFIKSSTQLAGTALVASQIPGCIKYEDLFYPSLANGITWSDYQLAVNIGSEGTNDTTGAEEPCVIKDNGTYKMWYAGNTGGVYRIIYCESANGVNWSNFPAVINLGASGTGFDTTYLNFPAVIKENGSCKIWYAGNNGNLRTIYSIM